MGSISRNLNKLRWSDPLFLMVVLVCVMLVRPRFIGQQGVRDLKTGDWQRAVARFDRAGQALPPVLRSTLLTASDRFVLHSGRGQALYHLALQDRLADGTGPASHARLSQARTALTAALALVPADYVTAFWLARTEHALELSHARLFPKIPNPHNAHDRYLAAAALRPAGIAVRQAHARYLHETARPDLIPALARTLTRIYPPVYAALKNEPWFTPALVPDLAAGLRQAVSENIRPGDALRTLSRLHQDQDNLTAAIDYFEQYLAHDPEAASADDFFLLGALYLADRRHAPSHAAFARSLAAARNPDALLDRIYARFKADGQFMPFLSLVQALKETSLVIPALDLATARCYLDMDQLFLARQTLEQFIARRLTAAAAAPAWYLLALAAQKEKDWDAMETAAQKAARLDPGHPGYHYLFAQALNLRKKYADAESAVTRAIRHAPRETAGYYNFRAWTRWHQEKYPGAALDWDQAAALNPDNPDFPDRAARAREKAAADLDYYLESKKY